MAKKKQYTLTKKGLDDLKKELDDRINVTRKELQDQLDTELSEGDVSENSSYYRVQDDIGSNEKRIEELEDIIRDAKVVENGNGTTGNNAKIGVGTKVTIKAKSKEITYHVVGSTEADPTKNKISVDSPLGKALVGKKVGEQASVKTPLGTQSYDIISIG